MTNTTRQPTQADTTQDFTAVLDLPASPESVSAWFTSAAGVSLWWGPTTGDGDVGGTLVTSFGEHGVNAVRVAESAPNRVLWEPMVAPGTSPTGHTQEWLGTRIEFDIAHTDTGTQLRFRQAGLTPKLACWQDCDAGWTYFLASIAALATTGTGTPFGT